MTALRVVLFAAGFALVVWTAVGAIRTVVVPRAVSTALTSVFFIGSRALFHLFVRPMERYEQRDRIMAYYAPVTLVLLPGVWLVFVLLGYTAMFWALLSGGWRHAFEVSGSSMLTLGFAKPSGVPALALSFTESAAGVGLLALLITYLPSMYAAFARREAMVAMLEVRAGAPPTAVKMIERYWLIEGLDRLETQWPSWEAWFAEIEESHTSFGALSFFRSPQPYRSWVTAAGTVLDAAAFSSSVLDLERAPQANLCIRAGYVALRAIADYFRIPFDPDPQPGDPISVTRSEFDDAIGHLAGQGVPLRADREQAWRDFAGWRVNYDTVLLEMAALVMAPIAPWVSDRSPPDHRPPAIRRWRTHRSS
jgi:hypothetical protein